MRRFGVSLASAATITILGGWPQAGLAAQSADGAAAESEDWTVPKLSYQGITLYGTVDLGVAYLTHGAQLSKTYGSGVPFVIQKYSNRPTTSLAPNGLGQSKAGLRGAESLAAGWSLVFGLETGFQPTSGRLTDGPASLVANNGVPQDRQGTNSDSSRAGQVFQGAAYAGFSSRSLGTITFGRQNSLMADLLGKYDPQQQAAAFSPLGYSGVSGGIGDSQDKTLDHTLKYVVKSGPVRLAAQYQSGSPGMLPGGGEEFDLGADFHGASVDALYGKMNSAVAATSLNAAQSLADPGTLAATISDNTAYSFQGSYTWKPLKVYAGYEHLRYANPVHPVAQGAIDIAGYVLSVVTNNAYTINRIETIAWSGLRYALSRRLDMTVAYYRYDQHSFNKSPCADTRASSCRGSVNDASVVADYKLTRRFDTYFGLNYASAADGLAAGYLYNTNWAPMLGVRLRF